jgi:hypothetical protein
MEAFRIPPASLRRKYFPIFAGCAASLFVGVISQFGGESLRGEILSVISIVFALVFTVSYSFDKRRVWLVLNKEGIEGRRRFGIRNILKWTTPVLPTNVSQFVSKDVKGFVIKNQEPGGVSIGGGTVFIPAAIFVMPEFRNALQKYAPANHALLIATQSLTLASNESSQRESLQILAAHAYQLAEAETDPEKRRALFVQAENLCRDTQVNRSGPRPILNETEVERLRKDGAI